MTNVAELRKQASKLGIKNYTRYKKDELSIMVANILNQNKKSYQPKEGTQASKIVKIFSENYKFGETYLADFAKKEKFPYLNCKSVISKYFGEGAVLYKRK